MKIKIHPIRTAERWTIWSLYELSSTKYVEVVRAQKKGGINIERKKYDLVRTSVSSLKASSQLESSSYRNCVGSLKTPAKYIMDSMKYIKAECAFKGRKGLNGIDE